MLRHGMSKYRMANKRLPSRQMRLVVVLILSAAMGGQLHSDEGASPALLAPFIRLWEQISNSVIGERIVNITTDGTAGMHRSKALIKHKYQSIIHGDKREARKTWKCRLSIRLSQPLRNVSVQVDGSCYNTNQCDRQRQDAQNRRRALPAVIGIARLPG